MEQGTKSNRNKEILKRVLDGETITVLAAENNLSYNRTRVIVYECIARIFNSTVSDAKNFPLAKLREPKVRDYVFKQGGD